MWQALFASVSESPPVDTLVGHGRDKVLGRPLDVLDRGMSGIVSDWEVCQLSYVATHSSIVDGPAPIGSWIGVRPLDCTNGFRAHRHEFEE